MLKDRKYSFHMLIQFSKGNNVQDTAASMLDGFLPEDTPISTFQQDRPIFREANVSPT
jgi:hypothetical protein